MARAPSFLTRWEGRGRNLQNRVSSLQLLNLLTSFGAVGSIPLCMARKEKAETTATLVAGGTVLVGLWLLSDPKCGRGCRTVAEHLVEHGVKDFFTGLFA